ncbi:MAG: hypothetical protein ABEJ22_00195 [Haloferacaceae archaeon]
MPETVKLSRLPSTLEELDYPVTREDAAVAYADVTLTYADGEGNLGEYVSEVGSDNFDSAEDLYDELQNVLPVEAVGEPGQSEGDA